MIEFKESKFYKLLQDFFINNNKETFLQMLAEFYNRTEGIIDKNKNQDDLIKELRELYIEFNEKGIDENIVREKVDYFVENNVKIKDILAKLVINTNKIEDNTEKLNTITTYKTEFINVVEIGCDNTGINDCTTILQQYINNGYSLFFPKGRYKCNLVIKPNITIYGEGLGLVTLIPNDKNKDVLYADLTAHNYTIKDLTIDGLNTMGTQSFTGNGIYLSNSGVLSQQDLEPHLENIKIINVKTGLKIDDGVRGGLFKNIKAGACETGVDHLSTDCIFTDCITAQTQRHGYFILKSNNTIVNCKAFIAGLGKVDGAGFKVQGSYNRLINCESQQNVFENLHLQNANYNIMQGLILDGAGYNSKNWFPSMTYQETGGQVPISSLRLYNSNGNIIDCNIIDGRLDSYCKTAIYNQWVGDDKENIIRANINNATEDSTMTNYSFNDENKYFKNNSITINGVLMRNKALKTPTIIDGQVEIISGGYIVENGICYISMSLRALKTQTWGNEILSGIPSPLNNIPLICSKADLICSLNVSGKIIYNPSISEGDTFNISATYIIK